MGARAAPANSSADDQFSPNRTRVSVLKRSSFRYNPLKPNSSNCYTMPQRPNLPFSISDIRALWRSVLSARLARISEIENGRLGLYGTEHSKCNQLMTLGFKGLMQLLL